MVSTRIWFNMREESRFRHAYDRTEVVPGAYVQYTFNLNDKLILLAGVRADYSTIV